MKIILTCLIIVFSADAISQKRDNIHYPILAYKAQSLGSGNYGYISYPGSNATSSLLTNAYMFGITDDFDFGIIPLYYTFGGNFFNTTYRYQILNKSNHQIGLSLTHIRYKMWEDNNSKGLNSQFNYEENKYTFGFTYNYTPQNQRINYALTINYKRVSSQFNYNGEFLNARLNKNGVIEKFKDNYRSNTKSLSEVYELILEGNYYIKRKYWIGLCLGNLRRDGQVKTDDDYIYDKNQITLGANLSYQGNIGILDQPSIGLAHFSRENYNSLVFSTRF